MKSTIWTHAFIVLLIVLAGAVGIVMQRKPSGEVQAYREKYIALRRSYVDLARSQSNILGLLLRDDPNLQTLIPEYKNVSKTEFFEQIRCQIRALKLQADALERE